jgi:formylmethanofuran dehydrogenase subunit C
MRALTLSARVRPEQTVDMSPLSPDRLSGLTAADVGKLHLRCGNRMRRVGDLFRISGNDVGHLRILGSTPRLDRVGAGLRAGVIEVQGSVGAYLGLQMAGGSIRVKGDAGSWAGSGMSGGDVTIGGSAGDFAGAALAGDSEGMSDGAIYIRGDAGDRLGDRQRRGLIVVEGAVGDYCGSRMLAGTIIVLGAAGRYVGAGMRRGTIILGRGARHIGATFNSCGPLKMEILRLLFRQLPQAHGRLDALRDLGPLAERFAGDLALGGKGELLVLLSSAERRGRTLAVSSGKEAVRPDAPDWRGRR